MRIAEILIFYVLVNFILSHNAGAKDKFTNKKISRVRPG